MAKSYSIIKRFEHKTKIRCVCGKEHYTKNKLELVNPCRCCVKDVRSEIANRSYNIYKASAKERNLSFNISPAHFDHLIKSNCFYCYAEPRMYSENIERVGIDRLNNSIGYEPENVISCCEDCNMKKGTSSILEFIDKIKIINERMTKYQSLVHGSKEKNYFLFKSGKFLAGSHVKRLLIENLITKEEIKYKIEDTLADSKAEFDGFINLLIEGISLYAGKKKARSKVVKTAPEKIKAIYKDFLENDRVDEVLMCKLIMNREWIKFD